MPHLWHWNGAQEFSGLRLNQLYVKHNIGESTLFVPLFTSYRQGAERASSTGTLPKQEIFEPGMDSYSKYAAQ